MNNKRFLSVIAIVSIAVIFGCKKDDPDTGGTNPIVVPLQTTVQSTVNLGSDADF
jgi:hypothetical protein